MKKYRYEITGEGAKARTEVKKDTPRNMHENL